MARSITTIYDTIIAEKQSMGQLNNLQPNIESSQQLLSDLTATSRVARWRLIYWIVAVAIWIHEKLFDSYREEIEALSNSLITGTLKWYQAECLKFQFGDTLEWNGAKYVYLILDPTKQIVQRAAVVEGASQLIIKVAKLDPSDIPEPLSAAELSAFSAYISQIKFAGTNVAIITDFADELRLSYDIHYDPQLITSTGESIATTGVYPVEDVIISFIQKLPFNGVLNLTKLTDAIQAVEGVIDPVITSASARYGAIPFQVFTKKYQANAGHMKIDPSNPLNTTLNYIAGV